MNSKEKEELQELVKKCLKVDGTAKSRAGEKDLLRIEELSGKPVTRAAAKPPAKPKDPEDKPETPEPKGSPVLVIDAGDPFAAGVLRVYNRASKRQVEFLPLPIYKNDPAAVEVLKQYVLRAEGGCDLDRGRAGRAALDKIKPGWNEKASKKNEDE